MNQAAQSSLLVPHLFVHSRGDLLGYRGTLVMLHTLWRTGEMYTESEKLAQHLAVNNFGIRVLAPDLLGHGKSTSSPTSATVNNEYSIERQALAVVNTIVRDVAPGTPITLFGYSLSGPIALAVGKYLLALEQYPLHGIILVAPVFAFQILDNTTAHAETKRDKIMLLSAFGRNRLVARLYGNLPMQMFFYSHLFNDRTSHTERSKTTNPDAVHGTIRSVLGWCPNDAAAAIRRNNIPVLIIDGATDPLRWNDPKRKMLLKALGNGAQRIVAQKGSDHTLVTHESDFVFGNVARFLGIQHD